MDYNKAPKASEVIIALQKLIDKHGDLKVCADDPDTSYRMRIGVVHKEENRCEECPERFEIKTEYGDTPEGLVGIE